MNALSNAISMMSYYESNDNAERSDRQRQAAETYALIAIAQELRRMNERAEADTERAALQKLYQS